MPDPLHPAVVHLPIALAILLPGLAILGIFAIQRRLLPARSWALIVLLQAALVGSGWLALETGEDQEERVERVVAERHIETHEEAAERFLAIAGMGLIATGAGLLPQRMGVLGRVAGTLATFAVLAAGISVGHSGGQLVYVHGAASAYVDGSGVAATARHLEDD
ncbi:MAG: hypothetical protein ACQGVC_08400 [Myxococcota bacterium]